MLPRPLPAGELLVLHALRLLGMAEADAAAARFRLDRDEVGELLLDLEANGQVTHVDFAGHGGWTLTDAGREQGARLLAAELAAAGAAGAVQDAHDRFVPLNARFLGAATRWQLRPAPGDPLAMNDHSDPRWDDRVLDELASVGRRLEPVCGALVAALPRFDGYAARYVTALARAEQGQHRWIDGVGIDSCHTVWIQLHEDLLATLGLERSAEG